MEVLNVTEQQVWSKLDAVLANKPKACQCDKCKADIVAHALNNLKPKYVVSRKGEVFARSDYLSNDAQVAIIKAIATAIEVVSPNPRHEKD